MVVQNGRIVVDGAATSLKAKGIVQGANQDWMKDPTVNGRGEIVVSGGLVQTSGDLVIARAKSSVGSLRVSAGTLTLTEGTTVVIDLSADGQTADRMGCCRHCRPFETDDSLCESRAG